MATKAPRKILTIDQEKCNGCGACVPACAEGALQIINGKAKLVRERYCDGLGACLGECPQGAITIQEREVEEFDQEAAEEHLARQAYPAPELPCGCPGTAIAQREMPVTTGVSSPQESLLGHWPVQLALVPPQAPFLRGQEILLAADCVPFAYAGFHQDFLAGRALLVACPKLDDFRAHLSKLTAILRQAQPKGITIVRMEVPCCGGLTHLAREAIRLSGRDIPLEEVVIGLKGELKSQASG